MEYAYVSIFYVQQKTPYHHPPWYKNTNKISNPATWTKFKTTPKLKHFFALEKNRFYRYGQKSCVVLTILYGIYEIDR